MKILFFTDQYPNYVPDLLLHGLRKLLGPGVVDFPRKDCVYQGVLGLGVCPEDQRCPNWFPDNNGVIDRDDIWRKVSRDYFNYIICDSRAFTNLLDNLSAWPSGLIVVDGEDFPAQIPPGKYVLCRRETDGSDYCIPLPMAMPEEILQWIASYDTAPKQYSIGFLGSTPGGVRKKIAETIVQYYPDALLQISAIPTVTEPSPGGRLGRDDYYRNLQKCRVLLSLPGKGYDTFRFWENASCTAVHVSAKTPLFIPNDFIEESHIFRIVQIDELRSIIDRVLEKKIKTDEVIRNARQQLVQFHLTTKRAEYFLDRVKKAFAL
jgi:hypothetical protein